MFKSFYLKTKKSWPWLGYFFIFSITFFVFCLLATQTGVLCPDGFYHTKMALLIKEQGLIKEFPWTQFTTYKDLFVDHHFLYHIALIPFLSIPSPKNLDSLSLQIDPLIKAKIGTAFFAALAMLMIYWLMRKLKIKKPFFWVLFLFLVPGFMLRLSLIRAPGLSLIFLILGLYFIIKQKYIFLSILSFFYVWTYGAWPLMLVRFFIIVLCFFRAFFVKKNIKLFFACALGLTLGLIINPYFPKTFPFYWLQTFKIAFLNYQTKIGVGAEWYAYPLAEFIKNNLLIFIPWVVSLSWFLFSFKKQNKNSWFFAFCSTFFLFYTLKARRNIEYFAPMALFFNGLCFTQIEKKINWVKIKKDFKNLCQGENGIFYFLLIIFLMTSIIAGFLAYFNLSMTNLFQEYKNTKRSLTHLQKSSNWLKNNTQPKEIIFQGNWGIFPELFYFNHYNFYINGLDQTFMYEKDPETYKQWADLVFYHINSNETAKILKQTFRANYVLVDKQNNKFIKLLKKSKGLTMVYEDEEAISLRSQNLPACR